MPATNTGSHTRTGGSRYSAAHLLYGIDDLHDNDSGSLFGILRMDMEHNIKSMDGSVDHVPKPVCM